MICMRLLGAALLAAAPALASAADAPAVPPAASPFHMGPVFTDFAPVAAVDFDLPIPPHTAFKVLFNAHDGASAGQINRVLESAGRFINMHVAAGVPLENIHLAVVVHGPAAWDLVRDDVYRARNNGTSNASAGPIAELLSHNVDIYLCGQTAAALGISKDQLLPGVKLSLSAMTATALLQQDGYTLNP